MPVIVQVVWDSIQHESCQVVPKVKEKHLLWILNYMRTYEVEDVNILIWKVKQRSTFRKRIWQVAQLLNKHLINAVTSFFFLF